MEITLTLKSALVEDVAFFKDKRLTVAAAIAAGDYVLYTLLQSGVPVVEAARGRTAQETLSALRRKVEDHLAA